MVCGAGLGGILGAPWNSQERSLLRKQAEAGARLLDALKTLNITPEDFLEAIRRNPGSTAHYCPTACVMINPVFRRMRSLAS